MSGIVRVCLGCKKPELDETGHDRWCEIHDAPKEYLYTFPLYAGQPRDKL